MSGLGVSGDFFPPVDQPITAITGADQDGQHTDDGGNDAAGDDDLQSGHGDQYTKVPKNSPPELIRGACFLSCRSSYFPSISPSNTWTAFSSC